MALSPEVEIFEPGPYADPGSSSTFRIDFDKGRLTSDLIDGLEALKQFIYMEIRTLRYAHVILSDDKGCELEYLMRDPGATVELKRAEIPRMITEALIYDERIEDVGGFDVEHRDDAFHIAFTVQSVFGAFRVEEVL